MSLYNRYRPKTLEEIVGNDTTIATLKSFIARESGRPQAFLFAGGKGLGKTTLGRILATALGTVGMDLEEFNSADFRGIDTIRDILRKARMSPMEGPVKTFILDECHLLTAQAEPALLKLLEEPPPNVYIILCTTNPEKLLGTIVDRCQRFEMEKLSHDQLFRIVRRVSHKEGKSLSKEAIEAVVESANGSARAALVTLDAVIDLPPQDVLEAVRATLPGESTVATLCQTLIAKGPWVDVTSTLSKMDKSDVDAIRRSVLRYMVTVLMKKDSPRAYLVASAFRQGSFKDNSMDELLLTCYEALS